MSTHRGGRRTPLPPPSRGAWSRLATLSRWWALAAGLLAGRLVAGAPGVVAGAFDLALAAGIAFLIARAYRRWARRRLSERPRRQSARERD